MIDDVAAVIVAAGSSSRMNGKKKEYEVLPDFHSSAAGEKPLTVLGSAARAFASCNAVSVIVIVIPENGEADARDALPHDFIHNCGKKIIFAHGGSVRRDSVYNGLSLLKEYSPSIALIHDGARPWIKKELIEKIIKAARIHGAVIPAVPLVDTPKEIVQTGGENEGFVIRHLKRGEILAAQTPQGFKYPEILKAHEKAAILAAEKNIEYTDDAEVWAEIIGPVAFISGDPENKKITFPGDLVCSE